MLEAGLYVIIPLELVRGVSVGQGAVRGAWGLALDIIIKVILTEGDTQPLCNVSSHHTAVFSIRTVVCGTTRQSNASTKNSGDQLISSCNRATCWHCSPTRELPLYTTRVNGAGVADPGTW